MLVTMRGVQINICYWPVAAHAVTEGPIPIPSPPIVDIKDDDAEEDIAPSSPISSDPEDQDDDEDDNEDDDQDEDENNADDAPANHDDNNAMYSL